MLIILKIFLVPTVILVISYVGRIFGPSISGWLGGLPIIAGPILLFLYFDQGLDFAKSAAIGALAGVSSLVAFCFTYAQSCKKFRVSISLTLSILSFLISTAVFLFSKLDPNFLLVAAILLIFSATKYLPSVSEKKVSYAVPNKELIFRMFAAGLLVLLITGASTILGPRLSGLLAPFPIAGTILAGFSHHYYGSDAAITLIRGFLRGLVGMAIFDYVLVTFSASQSFEISFVLGFAAALIFGGVLSKLLSRQSQRTQSEY